MKTILFWLCGVLFIVASCVLAIAAAYACSAWYQDQLLFAEALGLSMVVAICVVVMLATFDYLEQNGW